MKCIDEIGHANEVAYFRYSILDSLESVGRMAVERTIIKNEDGTAYSEQVGVFFTDNEEKKRITYYFHPDMLYDIIHGYMEKTVKGGTPTEKPEGLSEEIWQLRKRLAKLARSTVDGFLLIAGDMIVTVMTGSKDYPKKPKGVDRIEWYSELYARLGVSYLMQNDTLLYGVVKSDEVDNCVIEVTGLLTRPVTVQEATIDTSTS